MVIVDNESIREVAMAAGADTVGFTSADPFPGALETIQRRKGLGMAGPLHFTYDEPALSTDIRRSLPWARSLVVVGASYIDRAPPPAEAGPVIGLFATRDHYRRVRDAASAVIDLIERSGARADMLVDDDRFVDRAAAVRAGVGWIGRSTMVLTPGHGPWQLLGSVATDLELTATAPMRRTCGTCIACIPACPTGAITEDGLDARLCISTWLQTSGSIPHWIRPLIERRIYGCDDCLTSCPPGSPAMAGSNAVPEPHSFAELLSLSDEDLIERFSWFYIPHREARFLRRNLLVAAGNSGEEDAVPAILDHFRHRSSLVRGHAYWALARSLAMEAWVPLREAYDYERVADAREELELAMLMMREPHGG